MMTGGHPLSLAAATILDADHFTAVEVAGTAGFDALGLRWDLDADRGIAPPQLRRAIDDTGLRLLDLEVIRLSPDIPLDNHRRLIDIAEQLRPEWLLTVSHHRDPGRTCDELLLLADLIEPFGCSISLEFMAFTEIRTLADALGIAASVRADGAHNIAVLVDALHLDRSGGSPTDLRTTAATELSYLQICDADSNLVPPHDDPEALAFEARHGRRFPGDGTLPLAELIAQVPAMMPISVEVQSREWTSAPALTRARRAMSSARRVLA